MSNTKKQFTLHPALIKQIIHNQSGTLSKAILEGVMNSVDSIFLDDPNRKDGRCEIELTTSGFSITDNGKGMTQDEIFEFWEVFGAPHSEGDGSTFGRFRIGRAQLFAHAKTTWRTNDNLMIVDIESEPSNTDVYGYEFKKADTHQSGMHIVGELYSPLPVSELSNIENELKEFVRYIDCEIILNGKCISNNPDNEKWDYQNNDFYIRRLKNTEYGQNIRVYNLGALVPGFTRLPVNCEVVSKNKKVFKLNTARNEVLATCPLYKKLVDVLEEMIDKTRWKDLSDSEKESLVQRYLNDPESIDYSHPFSSEIYTYKVFKTLNDRKVSIADLMSNKTYILGSYSDSVIADKAWQQGIGIPLYSDYLYPFRMDTKSTIEELYKKHWNPELSFLSISEVQDAVDVSHKELDPKKDLTKKQQIAFHAIRKGFTSVMPHTRKIRLGESGLSAYAWTDGHANIWVDKDMLVKPIMDGGLLATTQAALTLVHEMTHDNNSSKSNNHGHEFNEKFRENVENNHRLVGKLTNAIFKIYANNCVKEYGQKGLSKNYKRVLDSLSGVSQKSNFL